MTAYLFSPQPTGISCTISGSELLSEELRSPLMILAIALDIGLLIPASFILVKRHPRLRKHLKYLVPALASVTLAIVAVSTIYAIRPGLDYGVWLNNTYINVRFYDNNTAKLDLCNTSITLTSARKALGMLSLRLNGLADPFSGIHMGYYHTTNHTSARVIIVLSSDSNKEKALVFHYQGEYVIVSLPCITDHFYKELLYARSSICQNVKQKSR